MTLTLSLLAGLFAAALGGSQELRLSPVLTQNAVLFLSDEVSAGGLGGGAGVQLLYRDLYLAQLDASALWGLSNAASTRLALRIQWPGIRAPAGWIAAGAIWGHRVEFLTGDGTRLPLPTGSMGLRAAPLRFAHDMGVVTALEPGVATNFRGGLWLEVTVLQIGLFL